MTEYRLLTFDQSGWGETTTPASDDIKKGLGFEEGEIYSRPAKGGLGVMIYPASGDDPDWEFYATISAGNMGRSVLIKDLPSLFEFLQTTKVD